MTPRQQRTLFVVAILAGVAVAATLVFLAVGQNMLYFYSPTQLRTEKIPLSRSVRVGGLVEPGTVKRTPGSLAVSFKVTDTRSSIEVRYTGILPDLFRAGQGIVVLGKMEPNGTFLASQVLAKHDATYMPPDAAQALRMARNGGKMRVVTSAPAGATQ